MSNPHRKARRAKRYTPKMVRTPLMGHFCDKISLDMHLALARLFSLPTTDARDDLADTLNLIGLTIQGDSRFAEELAVLNRAAAVLDPYQAPAELPEDGRHILSHAASVIDTILGLLDAETLYAAERAYVAAMRAIRAKGGREHAC